MGLDTPAAFLHPLPHNHYNVGRRNTRCPRRRHHPTSSGSSKRDFRVHKLVLSLASPVFKDMFSLPQPTSDNSRGSRVAELEIVEVMDPTNALEAVLRMIYPFAPPSFDGNLDTRGMSGHHG